jgi:hypothetical protein
MRAGALLFAEISEMRGCEARRVCRSISGRVCPPTFIISRLPSGGASAPIDEARVQERNNRASRISERFCAPALMGALCGLFRLHGFIAVVSGNSGLHGIVEMYSCKKKGSQTPPEALRHFLRA